jgi:POT family proton-dependent oligopeptide transporter
MSTTSQSHPKGLYVLFATEMWERFNYYGMRAILVLFLVKAMAFNQNDASQVYGSYTGLVYLTPLLGGYIADRYWGNKRSIIAGGLVMAIGEFVLFFCGHFYDNAALAMPLFYTGLGCMIAGNGFFKPKLTQLIPFFIWVSTLVAHWGQLFVDFLEIQEIMEISSGLF